MNNNYENILNRKLERIYKFRKKNNEEEACIEYYNLVLEFEKLKFKDINKLYYECGILLFNNHYYEDSVILLSKAYSNQYMKKEIKKFIFENFIEPNREEFYESFKINNEKCKEKYFERFDIAYE
ncbi:hypothetical protein, partial [uncultured Clostridium sp.]|uniref:hypothetical protein n=1 Tax=uncultured Clostridium sp. TaxID=59620 RepID=UPI0025E131B8